MNKDMDSSLVDGLEYNKTLKYPKSVSQAEELPKKTLIVHLLRCMSQRNLPEIKNIKELNFIEGYECSTDTRLEACLESDTC